MHYSIFIRGNRLVTIQLLTVESPVVVAICNIERRVLCTYLDGLGMQRVAVISTRSGMLGSQRDTDNLNVGIQFGY